MQVLNFLKILKRFWLTSGFREVFAKQKFGWSLQGGISKSLLCGETASRPTEGTVFKNPLYIKNEVPLIKTLRGGCQI